MASPVSLRLDKTTRQRIARIARSRRKTVSQVMREAIETGLEKQEPPVSLYDSIADLIGIVHGGNPRRSVDMGRRFSELLRKRRRLS